LQYRPDALLAGRAANGCLPRAILVKEHSG
jgi:hypothetical protein